MSATYISIEKNTEIFEIYKRLWANRGITGIRADTMTEGIQAAAAIEKSKDQSLYFVDIAADDIDFMPLLSVLDEAVDAPILIATSNYSEDEHHKALNNGAYFYGPYCDDPEKNINGVLAAVNSYRRAAKKQKIPPDILSRSGVLISLSQHKTYVNDAFVALTPQEFNVLHILMANSGKAMKHGEIYSHIQEGEYNEETAKYVIYNPMNRLCKKLRKVSNREYILSVYDVGYTFSLDTQ